MPSGSTTQETSSGQLARIARLFADLRMCMLCGTDYICLNYRIFAEYRELTPSKAC